MQEIQELKTFFDAANIPTGGIGLNNHTYISDVHRFIKSHLAIAQSNAGNERFLPYLERLQSLKSLLTNKKHIQL